MSDPRAQRFADSAGSLSFRLAAVCTIAIILGAVYWIAIRPAQLHWGATPEEIKLVLPEDSIVATPTFDATRAITIHARPEQIWPWLVQMGYGRAGFYGYDLIENPGSGRGLHSATAILPEFQHPQTGEVLPISVAARLEFGTVDPGHILVWRAGDRPPSGVYIWALVPVDGTHTRLISRIRWRYLKDPQGRVLGLFTEFADHVAVRAILRGVRDRVEGRKPESLVLQGFEIAAWLLAFAELLAAMVLVVVAHQPYAWWFTALGVGLMLLLLLYSTNPAWFNVVVPWLWLCAMLLAFRSQRSEARMLAKHPPALR
jgi:hypothetical protein